MANGVMGGISSLTSMLDFVTKLKEAAAEQERQKRLDEAGARQTRINEGILRLKLAIERAAEPVSEEDIRSFELVGPPAPGETGVFDKEKRRKQSSVDLPGVPELGVEPRTVQRRLQRDILKEASDAQIREGLASGRIVRDPETGQLTPTALAVAREKPRPGKNIQALDTKTGKPTFITQEDLELEPRRYQPMRSGVNVNLKPGKTPDQFSQEDMVLFPESWRDINEGTKTRDDYTTRGGERTLAVDAAAKAGRVLPTRKAVEEAQTAQQAVAQARSLLAELDAPIDPKDPSKGKVGDYFGPASGRITGLQQRFFGGSVPAAVTRSRARLSKFSAKDRHELFGANLTKIESQFSAEFEPDPNLPASTIREQLNAYISSIVSGMDATWGGSSAGGGEPAPTATSTKQSKRILYDRSGERVQ